MQAFQSHKIVEAGEVLEIDDGGPDHLGATVRLSGDETLEISQDIYTRIRNMAAESGNTLVGGYLVRYKDGFVSWSPAAEFKDGYTPVQPSSGKSKIVGYRQLSEDEISHMNAVKEHGRVVGVLVETMRGDSDLDQRWVAIGRTHLQEGFQALTRSIAKPEFF